MILRPAGKRCLTPRAANLPSVPAGRVGSAQPSPATVVHSRTRHPFTMPLVTYGSPLETSPLPPRSRLGTAARPCPRAQPAPRRHQLAAFACLPRLLRCAARGLRALPCSRPQARKTRGNAMAKNPLLSGKCDLRLIDPAGGICGCAGKLQILRLRLAQRNAPNFAQDDHLIRFDSTVLD